MALDLDSPVEERVELIYVRKYIDQFHYMDDSKLWAAFVKMETQDGANNKAFGRYSGTIGALKSGLTRADLDAAWQAAPDSTPADVLLIRLIEKIVHAEHLAGKR